MAWVTNLLAELRLQVLLQLCNRPWVTLGSFLDVCVCVGTLTFQVQLLTALQETIHHPVK